jgi:cobalt/nickel transport protein
MSRKDWLFVSVALGAALVVGSLLSPFSSVSPDGLEKVAANKGFLEKGEGDPAWKGAPAPDYEVPGVTSRTMSKSLAGFIGTLLVFSLGFGLAKVLARKRNTIQGPGSGAP